MSDLLPLKQDEKTMAMLAHLLSIFVGFIAPLIIWLLKKDESSFVDRHGKEALNFQISVAIYCLISTFLTIVIIGIFLLIAVLILNFVFIIVAAVKANKGEEYSYPLSIRLVR